MKLRLITILSVAAILVYSTTSVAQIVATASDQEFGVTGSINYQSLNSSIFNPTYSQFYNFGMYAESHLEGFNLQIELLYGNSQFRTINPHPTSQLAESVQKVVSHGPNNGDFKNDYFYIPLIAEFNLTKNLVAQGGFQFSYLLHSKDVDGDYTKLFKSPDNIFRKGENSVVAGLEYRLFQKIKIGARYNLGVSNINKGSYDHAYDAWHLYSLEGVVSYRIKG